MTLNGSSTHEGDELFPPFVDKQPSLKGYKFAPWHILAAILVLFPYISIIILFALVSSNGGDTTKNYYTTEYNYEATSTLSTTSAIASGSAVSLTNTGRVQAGGGTSIYKNIAAITASCPAYVSMAAVYSDTYVVSYADKAKQNATLQVVVVDTDAPNTGVVVHTQQSTEYIFEIISLDQQSGIFVGISQDISFTAETAYVFAGLVDPTTYAITIKKSISPYTDEFSLDPSLSRMSDSRFAIAYYSVIDAAVNNTSSLDTRVGYVNPKTLAVTLSAPVRYLPYAVGSLYVTVTGLTDSQYFISYYNGTMNEPNPDSGSIYPYKSGHLQVVLVTVAGDVAAGDAVITTTNATLMDDSYIVYSLASTRINNNTAVVVYADPKINYGIRCQVITVIDQGGSFEQQVVFGSSWTLTTGQALTVSNAGYMDIDIEAITEENRDFMVLYSDVSNNGDMTAVMGQITTAGEVVRASPDITLNSGNDAIMSGIYSWGALSTGDSTVYGSRTAILYALADSDCSTDATTRFNFMEIKPKPLGLIAPTAAVTSTISVAEIGDERTQAIRRRATTASTATAVSDITVTVSGTSTGWTGLSAGSEYYTDTMGSLRSSDSYYGRTCQIADGGGSSTMCSHYYYENQEVILLSESKVGLATASDSLLVDAK